MVRSLVSLRSDRTTSSPHRRDLRTSPWRDLLIVNGGGLEGSLLDTLENAGGDATVVDASAGLAGRTPQPGEPTLEDGGADPHFWLDPVLAKTYVANIRDAFAAADPAGAAEYEANAAAYQRQLDELDAWITAQVAEIPEADRRLVMNHASHGYFADRYGLRIVGTVLPGASTGETPTARSRSPTSSGRSSPAERAPSSSRSMRIPTSPGRSPRRQGSRSSPACSTTRSASPVGRRRRTST